MSGRNRQGKNRIPAEAVKRNNSDLFRHDPSLALAMRKERFSKADPDAFIDYLDALGELEAIDPMDDLNLSLDLEKFSNELNQQDQLIFYLRYRVGMKQREIAEEIGVSQTLVSLRLAALRDQFRDFYTRD